MFLLSCHTRYRIDTLMNYPMGILVQKLMITESKSKGFLWGIFFCLFWVFLFVFFWGGFVCLFVLVLVFLVSFSHYSKAAGF